MGERRTMSAMACQNSQSVLELADLQDLEEETEEDEESVSHTSAQRGQDFMGTTNDARQHHLLNSVSLSDLLASHPARTLQDMLSGYSSSADSGGEEDLAEEQYEDEQIEALESEENQREREEMFWKRQKKEQNLILMDSNLENWLNPTKKMEEKIMFPKSWLLQYEPARPMLKALINLPDMGTTTLQIETKQTIIDLFQLEKQARQYYGNNIPKAYFTAVVAQRLLSTYSCPNGVQLLAQVIANFILTVKRGMSLRSEWEAGTCIPCIFLKAQEQYPQLKGDDDDSDDDSEVEFVSYHQNKSQQKEAELID